MNRNRFINRKTFLRLAAFGAVAAFAALWSMMTGKTKQTSELPTVKRINTTKLGTGIFIFDNFIVVKTDSLVKVFSNKCTHAGCRINKELDGQLLCPCHGSRYDSLTGNVLQGPAGKPLTTIPFTTDTKSGEITINI